MAGWSGDAGGWSSGGRQGRQPGGGSPHPPGLVILEVNPGQALWPLGCGLQWLGCLGVPAALQELQAPGFPEPDLVAPGGHEAQTMLENMVAFGVAASWL